MLESNRALAHDEDHMPLMGPAEVAKSLGVSSGWVRDHATRKSPRIPAVKIGKLLRFSKADIRNFIRDRSSSQREQRVSSEQW